MTTTTSAPTPITTATATSIFTLTGPDTRIFTGGSTSRS